MRLILLGPPGAGKGSLATLLKNEFQLAHISTGDLLRAEMKTDSELGQEVKGYVESGGLVPDDVITRILENRIKTGDDTQNGFMLDGYPRTPAQAEELDRILEGMNQPLEYALSMEADLSLILTRLTGRRVCRQCGALYHVANKPPQTADKCDECGGELYQRPDDNEETIRKRMDVYAQSTEPVIHYYANQGKVHTLNANLDTMELLEQVKVLFRANETSH